MYSTDVLSIRRWSAAALWAHVVAANWGSHRVHRQFRTTRWDRTSTV